MLKTDRPSGFWVFSSPSSIHLFHCPATFRSSHRPINWPSPSCKKAMYKTPSIRASASPCQGGCRICGLSELFGAMQSHNVSTRLFTRIASAKTEKPYPMTCAYHMLCTCLTTTTAAFDRVLRRKRQMGMNQILTEDLREVNQIVPVNACRAHLTPYRVRSARIPKTPHPVPLLIRWGEG